MIPHAQLRAATAADHAAVDAAFGTFDLAEAGDYRRFLLAHARAVLAVEHVLAAAPDGPPWRPRGPLIAADLEAMGAQAPPPLPLAAPGAAGLWGMGYVLEGSRLGGVLLARRIGAGLPAAYLGAQHGKGEWRGFLAALDRAGEAGGDAWLDDATDAARDVFALFAHAARQAAVDD